MKKETANAVSFLSLNGLKFDFFLDIGNRLVDR